MIDALIYGAVRSGEDAATCLDAPANPKASISVVKEKRYALAPRHPRGGCYGGRMDRPLVWRRELGPKPTPQLITQVTGEIAGGDPSSIARAVKWIGPWALAGRAHIPLRDKWLPALMDAQRYQDVADLSLKGAFGWLTPEFIEQMMQWRIKAFLAMNEPGMALHAAKSYYNACGFESTPQAVEEMGICLASAHPDDMEIVRRFRAEQATSGNSVVSDSTDADMGATPGMPSTQPSGGVSMVKSIEVDPAIFADEIVFRSKRDQRFADRSSYANVLLMADRASEAERIFHEQFQLAGTQAELNEAVEGIARCMRAEDGNVVRANAWLVTLQQNRTPAAN